MLESKYHSGYGNMVEIDHGEGFVTRYAHASTLHVKKGALVERGQLIADVGTSGRSTGPHLCWRLKWRGRNLDPELLTKWPARNG